MVTKTFPPLLRHKPSPHKNRIFLNIFCIFWAFRLSPAVRLYNHLRNTRAAQGLASDEGLALDTGKGIARGREGEDDGGGNQGAGGNDDAEPLDDRHAGVGGGAHVVGRDLADRGVEGGRGRADSEQERYFDE